MFPTIVRKLLNPAIFPNYLGVAILHYCPHFLTGQSAEEIHFSLNWKTLVLDNGVHNCFYWPCWAFKICPTTENPPDLLHHYSHWHCIFYDCAHFTHRSTPLFLSPT